MFKSKDQWRYLHARFGHKGFVKKWAQKQRGQFKALPKDIPNGSSSKRKSTKRRKK